MKDIVHVPAAGNMASALLYRLTALATLAGIVYTSWPLGYILNPPVAHKGLASELEGLHQPYNWLFIAGDIVSSCLVIVIAWLCWRYITRQAGRSYIVALAGYMLFAVFTILDAALPVRCDESISRCPSYHHDHLLLIHGILSIVASVCLFIGLATLWLRQYRYWLLDGIMVGYLLFGCFSLISAALPGRDNWAQHYYITFCGLDIAVLPYVCAHLVNRQRRQSLVALPAESRVRP